MASGELLPVEINKTEETLEIIISKRDLRKLYSWGLENIRKTLLNNKHLIGRMEKNYSLSLDLQPSKEDVKRFARLIFGPLSQEITSKLDIHIRDYVVLLGWYLQGNKKIPFAYITLSPPIISYDSSKIREIVPVTGISNCLFVRYLGFNYSSKIKNMDKKILALISYLIVISSLLGKSRLVIYFYSDEPTYEVLKSLRTNEEYSTILFDYELKSKERRKVDDKIEEVYLISLVKRIDLETIIKAYMYLNKGKFEIISLSKKPIFVTVSEDLENLLRESEGI